MTEPLAAGAPPRRSWIRHNALALALLVAIVPGLIGVLVVFPLSEIAPAAQAVRTVAAGDPLEFEGYEWTLTASKEFAGQGLDKNQIPTGTSLIAAFIEAKPAGTAPAEAASCDVALTSRVTGTERSWPQIGNLYDFNYRIAEDSQSYCQLSNREPFNLEVVFLVPPKSYPGATVDLALTGDKTTVLRFSLPSEQG